MKRLLWAGLAAFAGCGGNEPVPPPPVPAPASAAPPPAAPGRPPWTPAEGRERIGAVPPEFSGLTAWTVPDPPTLASLRGRPVLVRFWTTGCSLCTVSAPALNALHRRFQDRGLAVLGIHHPKTASGREASYMHAAAVRLGFEFPVAQDLEWSTVKSWWLDGGEREFTSASFLVGRDGRIAWVHPGGELTAGAGAEGDALRSLEAAIEAELGR